MKKQLSTTASDLLQKCAEVLNTSEDALINEFDKSLKASVDNCSRSFVEFCSSKAIEKLCCEIGEKISHGKFTRFTFDMMLAWQFPSNKDEEYSYSVYEGIGKEREDRKKVLQGNPGQIHDDIPLFYSDIMPLLVDEENNVGEDSFVWLGCVLPLAADVVNARFVFETLTAPTASRLHYPAYDRFLKEIDKYIKYLQKQRPPTGYEFAADEFILHVEGTGMTQRVVRHIGETSWPGRLTLTNLALYFEASKSISYDNALKIDLSSAEADHQVRATSTGPFGAPFFDRAITYESSLLSEPLTLEFPEMASSTRRDHWFALINEVIKMHKFISKLRDEFSETETCFQVWEVQARTILGIMRLHAAREMLRMAPPPPINFLIFTLLDEVPKGDYVLEELYNSLKKSEVIGACSAASILKSLNIGSPVVCGMKAKEGVEITPRRGEAESLAMLEPAIEQVREEAKEASIAKATLEKIKDEGIIDSIILLGELLSPLKNLLPFLQRIISWEKPALTFSTFVIALLTIYKEWFGPALAALLLFAVGMMLWVRHKRLGELPIEVVISPPSEKSTLESIVSAQHSLNNFDAMVKTTNITILKIKSIFVSKTPKHSNMAMSGLSVVAFLLMMVPFRLVLIGFATYIFMPKLNKTGKRNSSQGNRRLKEWWETIPVTPVRIVSES
ncbi:uncharacterized protein LOC110032324 isoform X2 [Phalaenopsis equestris]|uniref:uncharacterized protein LOC110032324 isoform X2 n=1 Tax=Phalaenopsis equestris TaxID=78828 RepID=UPI0009E63DA6|nr:uncharacterized protein LOC110032324 isoform X2 [Phalaenopsis equestris]